MTEHCVFYKLVDGELIIVIITVNYLTLTSSSELLLIRCKDELQSEFNISDLGPEHWLLGVKVKGDCNTQTITLSQKAYISSIVTCFHLEDNVLHSNCSGWIWVVFVTQLGTI